MSIRKNYYELYQNVKKKSYILNTFDLPFKALLNMNKENGWEFIELCLKDTEYQEGHKTHPVAVVFCYKTITSYTPLLIGLDYNYKFSHKNYKQAIYQMAKRGNELGCRKIYYGITASVEKRRVGAQAIPKSVFVQLTDSFNMEVLEMVSVGKSIL